MIAFHDNLPVIQFDNGEVVAFERDWLVRSLARAGQRAGYSKWWLAEHVAASVTTYLREQEDINVLPVAQLSKAVQSVLQVIGYGEVAQHFDPGPPKVRVSLVELAREAGSGYELAFFERLGRRIHEIVGDRGGHFELQGLTPCVKLLRSCKAWNRGCDSLREEIVMFAREQAGSLAARHEVTFSLQ